MRLPDLFEVWIDGRLLYLMSAYSLTEALCGALAEFPRRAVKVRLHRGGYVCTSHDSDGGAVDRP